MARHVEVRLVGYFGEVLGSAPVSPEMDGCREWRINVVIWITKSGEARRVEIYEDGVRQFSYPVKLMYDEHGNELVLHANEIGFSTLNLQEGEGARVQITARA